MVSVHPKLIEASVLALKNTTDGPYLIPGLETSKQGTRGAALACPLKLRSTHSGIPSPPGFETRIPVSEKFGLTGSLGMKPAIKVRAQPLT